jgi:hypothetical protein
VALGNKLALLASGLLVGCADPGADGPTLSKPTVVALRVGERVPDSDEASTVGALAAAIGRDGPRFGRLTRCDDRRVVFKDEEKTGADRMMTRRLCDRLQRLGALVDGRWPGVKLRVTEAWDEEREHGAASIHYEGRAADVTTSDVDSGKLGQLARLAVDAELDWVYFEDETHVHVSVKR